jgi:hypothetical protein
MGGKVQFGIASDFLSPPKRGEGWARGFELE